MPDEITDPLIAARAAIDQAVAGAPDLSRMLFGTFSAHVEAGFTEAQAMQLVCTHLQILLGSS